GDPRHFADHRLAVEILQLDLELAAAVGMIDLGVTADEALVLEHVEHADAEPRARGRDLGLLAHLRVVDARDQIADWIVDLHAILLPARLHEAGNQALGAELAQRDARHLVLAINRARPAGDLATVAVAVRRRVARQFGQLHGRREALFHRLGLVHGDRLQPRTAARILLRQLLAPVVLLDRTLLRHLGLLAIRVREAAGKGLPSLPEREVESG